MNAIEVFALILAVVGLIKLIVILKNPRAWINNVSKKVYANPGLVQIVSLVLAIIVLNYLLKEVSIVQIFAVMLFTTLLMAVSFAPYSKDFLAMATKIASGKNYAAKMWLSALVWGILIIWVLFALF